MLTIGDFARITGVSVRMLRHYDALGLLVPARVDPYSGYRYYSATQLGRANRLVALKGLGFTLEQVRPMLDDAIGVAELRGMLLLRHAQLAEQIDNDTERLRRVERRLRTIESEDSMSEHEYVIKSLPAIRLAQVTDRADDPAAVGEHAGPLFGRLNGFEDSLKPAGPAVGHYTFGPDGVTLGAGFPVATDTVPEGMEYAELAPVEEAMTVVHHGALADIGDVWQALTAHTESEGYSFSGTCREIYHDAPLGDTANWVYELQQPITRTTD